MNESLQAFIQTLGVIALVCVALAVVLLGLIYRRLRRIQLPPDADFWTTIRAVPFPLVLGLDLLDLGLDVLATPVVWLLLRRFRLQALRNVAVAEALIPFTQVLPTFTVAWIVARVFGLGRQYLPDQRIIDVEEIGADRYAPRTGRR